MILPRIPLVILRTGGSSHQQPVPFISGDEAEDRAAPGCVKTRVCLAQRGGGWVRSTVRRHHSHSHAGPKDTRGTVSRAGANAANLTVWAGGSRPQRCGAPAQWAFGVARSGSQETPAPAPRPPPWTRTRTGPRARTRMRLTSLNPCQGRLSDRGRERRTGGGDAVGCVRSRGLPGPGRRRKRRLQSGGGWGPSARPAGGCPPRGLTDAPARPRPRARLVFPRPHSLLPRLSLEPDRSR